MNVKTLLDELCKFVAEMIAQRTYVPCAIILESIKRRNLWDVC